jgi:ATP-dependent helicase IRC3
VREGTLAANGRKRRDYVDMIGEKWLSDVIFTTVESKADVSRVKAGANSDFQIAALSKAVNTEETNDITFRAWLAKAKDRKATLVFCVDLAHVSSLTAKFREYGVDARFITGDTRKKVRSERLDAFKNGEFPVLLNCGVFTEGTDIPNIDCVLLARPTKSRNLLVQMIGRGMRLYPGKKNCHIIDMVASLTTGIVTTPTLFGLDPSELIHEANVDVLEEMRNRKEEEQEREKQVSSTQPSSSTSTFKGTLTFTDYESVNDLIEDTSGERHIRAISPHAWVEVGDNRYILSTNSGNYITIQKGTSEQQYEVKYTEKLPNDKVFKAPFMRPRRIAEAETFQDAVHAADTFAAEVFEWTFISKTQAWRKQPATEAQLNFLNKFRDAGDQLTEDMVTKGRAGDMITKIKHGAKGRHERLAVQKRAATRVKEKIEQLRSREAVRVGPVA